MSKTKEQKKDILKSIKDKLGKSKSIVFSGDTGLDVKTVEKLRKELREKGSEYFVTKKTLLKLADDKLAKEDSIKDLQGSLGVTCSYEDEIEGVKVVSKFAKDNEGLEIGGGVLEGKYILPDIVKKLSSLPSKEELLAKLVGSLNSPLTGIVGVLSGTTCNFVGVLSAIKDKKE